MQNILSLCIMLGVLTGQEPGDPPRTPIGKTGAQADQPRSGKGKFTMSKETTFVTEPVDKDGYIDYVAALNDRLRQGVTPENNANVLIWKALGPRPEGTTLGSEFCK